MRTRTAFASPAAVAGTPRLAQNRDLFEQNRRSLSQADWQQHFGSEWHRLVHTKGRYEPNNTLGAGLNVFNASVGE